ncbi:hypothetical protein [Bradyrhizobium sp. URHC0002]
MTSKKDNDSAKQLWEQVFANLANEEGAALMDPEHDSAEDEARMAKGLRDSGWSEDTIRLVTERGRMQQATASVTSPGVNPSVELHLDRLCNEVEAAMDYLKLNSHAKIARGVEPRAWATAAKINVIMTEESIVTVSAFLFRFCGLIARAFLRTVRADPFGWDGEEFDLKSACTTLCRAPGLVQYWLRIYLSFAMTGTHVLTQYKPSTPDEIIAFEDIACAMEIFVVAHEYGHHHHRHGKDLDADSSNEEFEADQFALRIGTALEASGHWIQNPYLSSGAGGIVLLLALRTLRETEQALGSTEEGILDTHPEVLERIKRFDSVAALNPAEFQRLKRFRTAAERVMTVVHAILLPAIRGLPPDLLEDLHDLQMKVGKPLRGR